MVELMVILVILGVLMGIAIPFFLASRTRAQDRQAQSTLRTSLVAALTHFTSTDTFDGFGDSCTAAVDSCATAQMAEPSVSWVGPGAPGLLQVSIVVASGGDLLMVSQSSTGTFFCEAQQAGGTFRGRSSAFSGVDTIAECSGDW